MIALVIPILIFGMLGYWLTSRIVLDQTNKVYMDLLNQTQNSIESRISEIDALALTLAKSGWVSTIAYMQGSSIDYERMDSYRLMEYSGIFNNFQALNSLIYKTGLIFYNKNTIITPQGTEGMDWFFSHSFRFEKLSVDDLYNMIEANPDKKYIYPSNIYFYDEKSECLALLKRLPFLRNMDNVQLIVAIKLSTLQNLLQKDRLNGLVSYIIDDDKQILAGVNGGPFFEDALNATPLDKNIIPIYVKHKKHFIFHNKSEITNWTYAIIIPEEVLLGRAKDVRDATLWICICLIAAGIILSYGMAIRNYRPFKKLFDNVLGVSDKLEKGYSHGYNEIELLEKAFENIVLNGQEMERKMDECIPFALHSFFIKLLHGMINMEEIPLMKKLMDITDELDYWTVVLLYSSKNKEESLDKKLRQWNVDRKWTVYLIQLERDKYALITNTSDINTSRDIIKNAKDSIITDNTFIGVGRTYDSISGLSNSYIDAAIAIEYVHYNTRQDINIAFFEDIKKEKRLDYYYPIEKEEILINLLRAGNVDKVKAALNELMEENLYNLKISQFSLKCLFYNLISTALKALQFDNLLNLGIISDSNLMMQLSADNMREYIEDVYTRICAEVQSKKANRNAGSIQDILRYIDGHYTDTTISLTSVAAHFDITDPYLSRYFKDQTGVNFAEYITKKRIEKSKQLIMDCSLSLEKICNIIGYDNMLTFRRAFKKCEGVVPSEYRGFTNIDVNASK